MKASALSLVALLLTPLVALAQGPADLNTITRVEVRGGTVVITGTKKPNFTTFTMTDPARLVIDISEAVFSGVPEELPVTNPTITGIRTASYGSEATAIARVLIGFSREVETDFQADGTTLVVKVLGDTGAAVAQGAPAVQEPAQPAPAAQAPAATPQPAQVAAAPADAGTPADATAAARTDRDAQAKAAAQATAAAKPDREAQERAAAQAAAAVKADREAQERAAAQAAEAAKADREAVARAAAEAQATEAQRRASEKVAAEKQAQAEKQRLAEEAKRAEAEKQAQAKAAKEKQAEEARAAAAQAKAEAEQKQQAAAQAKATEAERKKQAAEQQRAEAAAKKEAAAQARAERAAAAKAQREEAAQRKAEARAERETQAPAPEPRERRGGATGRNTMTFVGFKQEESSSRVFVRTSEPVRYTVSEGGPGTLILELENTRIGLSNNTRALDTSFFDTAVAAVDPTAGPSRTVRIAIRLKSQVPYQARQEGNEVSLEFPRPSRR